MTPAQDYLASNRHRIILAALELSDTALRQIEDNQAGVLDTTNVTKGVVHEFAGWYVRK